MRGFGALPDFDNPALCAETDPDLFFPDKGGSVREPKAICRRCDARDECLKWALDHDEKFGVWGGLAEHERRVLRAQQERGLTAVEQRRQAVAEYLGKGWSAGAVAQLLGVPVHVVWNDRRLIQEAS